jgi:hypothetical protein
MFGFFLGGFTPNVEQGGRSVFHVFRARTKFYNDARRSVVPYLVNLGDEDPEALERRIGSIEGTRKSYAASRESDWNRWPEESMD